jgi:hypothetical protein
VRDSAHQGDKPAAAGDFEFAEDRVKVLFHHRQTQAGVISGLLITPSTADKPRDFLFAPRESDKMWQTGVPWRGARSNLTAQILALDKKMRTPTPIGRVIQEQPSGNLGPEPWVITKVSNSTEFAEFRGALAGREMR